MRARVNDGSGRPPRLEVHQSWWGMIGLPRGGPEWSTEEKLARIAAAGFTGLLGSLPEPKEEERWRRLLAEHRLSFAIHSFPRVVSDLKPLAERARSFGVQYINSQVQDSFVVGDEAVRLLEGLIATCAAVGLPYFVETHRGRVTQDLLRTVEYVARIPDLRLTIDLSHYVVAGEIGAPSEDVEACFDILLRRTGAIHARVSNGEQVQVDIGDGGAGPVTHFVRWWEKGMRYWLQGAGPGDILPFVVELGPPTYSITAPDGKGTAKGPEISDRWEQALVYKRLAEVAWERALAG